MERREKVGKGKSEKAVPNETSQGSDLTLNTSHVYRIWWVAYATHLFTCTDYLTTKNTLTAFEGF